MRPLFFILGILGVGMAAAQLAPQAPQAAYEGQNVTAVSLIANPHRDLTPLLPLLAQEAGEPYSEKKVQESVTALEQRGGFEKVRVEVVPEIQGLRLEFLLEPAWYLGVVKFSGATKSFAYTRLLQVVNLSDEDPYDPARIPVAVNSVQQFLQKNGYFLAKVHAEPAIDDAHRLVSVNFIAEMGKHARIGGVEIEGPADPERAKLLHSVRSIRARMTGALLKPGKPYTPERIKAASAAIKKALARHLRLASHVEENPPHYHRDTNRVDVSFRVEVGPMVTVRTTGAKLSVIPFLAGREMKKLIPIHSEGTIDQDLVDEGQRNLIDYFQKKGYYDVKVNTKFEQQPDQILVVYQIDRGKKHKVGEIAFHGNHAISDKDLLAQVSVKKSHIWTHGSLSQKLIKQSSDNIEALYLDRGYEDVKVTSQAVDHEPTIKVSFNIQEGAQTLVEDVRVSGNEHVPYDQLTAPVGFQLRLGVPFSPRQLTNDRNRISATYLNRGYLNAEIKVSVNRSDNNPHQVDVVYAITEHQLVRMTGVVFLGQKHTQLSLIKKTAELSPEEPMRRIKMLEAESRLYDLNIFDWSSVGPRKPITDQTDEDALVKVHESKRNDITYGFGFEMSHRGGNIPGGAVAIPGGGPTIGLGSNQIAPSQSTYASPRGLIEFNRRNMRGLGETASASILASRLDQRALLTYTQPHFSGSQWSSLSSFSLERTSENPLFIAGLGDTRDKPLDAHHGVLGTLKLGDYTDRARIECQFCKALRTICLLQCFSTWERDC